MSSEFEGGSGPQEGWEAEARARWGETDAYKESSRRTRDYTPEQWEAVKAEMDAIEARFAELLASGAAADSPEAMETAEDARRHIHRRYYPCSHAMHAGLAEMYTADARFRAHYEERAEGLARFVADAIRANAARAER